MNYENNIDFAKQLDANDPLREYRDLFHLPETDGKNWIYLCGNSLGLQPKSVRKYVEQELKDWETLGVEGHFDGKNPWFYYHHFLTEASARLVGAESAEVVVMNSLTVNLNLLMISFYQPNDKRNKIIIEADAFPSDRYACQQQIKLHGYNPDVCLVELKPREGEHLLRTEDITKAIEDSGDELALVMLGGINYYTGQCFEFEEITKAGHSVGAMVGFDLAHAAGNVKMELHKWDVDFACWCTYKYLNSGPGGTSGAFVHERHCDNPDLPRLAGWWGNDEETRFQMLHDFVPQHGAAGWQMSNAQVLPMAAHLASLEIFDEVGLDALIEKSRKLTGFLEHLLTEEDGLGIEIITPKSESERGCQLSLLTGDDGKQMHQRLKDNHIIADWREPNVIRIAPVPLYNTFEEVYEFVQILKG